MLEIGVFNYKFEGLFVTYIKGISDEETSLQLYIKRPGIKI